MSQPFGIGIKHEPIRSFSRREANISLKGIDHNMFPSKQKPIKSLFSAEGAKKVRKAISKFFLSNPIPFNAVDSETNYQSMINAIVEASPGIKGPIGYQICNAYLKEEVKELEVYINTLKVK